MDISLKRIDEAEEPQKREKKGEKKNGREVRRKKGLKERLLFMNRPKSLPALAGVLLNSWHNLAHLF